MSSLIIVRGAVERELLAAVGTLGKFAIERELDGTQTFYTLKAPNHSLTFGTRRVT